MSAPAGDRRTLQLVLTCTGVLVAAADAYVVVLALTSIMSDLDISIDQLQQATPIVTGFLVGYVAVLPVLGRLSDIYGRMPVFTGCLIAFAAGSLVTASAHSLAAAVIGRSLQGLGGGGMVPVTLALIADLWPAERRSIPLGMVGGVQEFGSVLGPLYGAAIISLASWRVIFWLNIPLAIVLGAGLLFATRSRTRPGPTRRPLNGTSGATPSAHPAGDAQSARSESRRDIGGGVLLLATVASATAALTAPAALANNAVAGALYAPLTGTSPFTTPIVMAAAVAAVLFCIWEISQPFGVRPLLRLRGLPSLFRAADWLGSLLLIATLAAVIISFAAADPSRQVISPLAAVLLPAGAAAAIGFVLHERRSAAPLVRFAALRARAAMGAMGTNVFIGSALMAALVDVPLFARTTAFPDSQLGAALVLLRLLAAVPVGAVAGGFVAGRLGYRIPAAFAMLLSAVMFAAMSRWNMHALDDPLFGMRWLHASDLTLICCGLGFGLAIAPVNAAMLAAVGDAWHGLASAMVVVSRSTGMLIGLSVLTAAGLRRFNQLAGSLPSEQALCPATPTSCPAYDELQRNALIGELQVIFTGAAVACIIAGMIALATLRVRNSGPDAA